MFSQLLWNTVWSAPGLAQNLEEADLNGWKYLQLTNFHKFEHFSTPTKITKQKKKPSGMQLTTRDTLIVSCSSNISHILTYLTLSWRRQISYRNQSTDLQSKSMYWFLYDIGLRHERVKTYGIRHKYVKLHIEYY